MEEEKLLNTPVLSDQEIDARAEALLASNEKGECSGEQRCKDATILFRYGLRRQKGRPLLLALNYLMEAEENDPLLFELSANWRHLWGNILVHLSRLVQDSSFVDKALHQYAQAAKVGKPSKELYWDWAQAWLLLGARSAEENDLKRGLEKFYQASALGCDAPLFRIDLAVALMIFGTHTGDPAHLDEALTLLQGVVADTYDPDGDIPVVHARAWVTYARVAKQRYFLSHLPTHLEEADVALREAILSVPSEADLWLDWGDLYLYGGWLRHDIKALEAGLDKLTSSKVKEADPLRLSALLGKGLVFLGLYLEDLKLIKEGKGRIESALEIAPKQPDLLLAAGYAELALGIYFSQSSAYAQAAQFFSAGIEFDSTSVRSWHGLFQTYLSWGVAEGDPSLARKGVQAITRVSSLRPHSPIHLNEWGVSLLQLKQLEQDLDSQQALVEEALLKFKHAYSLHEDLETLYNWGCAQDQLGDLSGDEEDYEKAIELLSKVYAKNPYEPHVVYHLGLALAHLGELMGDVDSLTQAIELFEPLADADSEDATVWGDLGYTLLNLSELVYDSIRPEKGEQYRREAERRLLHAAEAGNPDANYHLACLYSLAELIDTSIVFLKRAEAADALPPQEDLAHDEWLANVRETELFKEFMLW